MSISTKLIGPGLVLGICSVVAVAVTCPWWAAVMIAVISSVAVAGAAYDERVIARGRHSGELRKAAFTDFITGAPIKRRKHIACLVRTRELEAWHADYDSKHDDYGAELVHKTDRHGTTRVYDSLGNCVKIERGRDRPEYGFATGATGYSSATGYSFRSATGPTGPAAPAYQCESCKQFNIGPTEMMTLNKHLVAVRCGRCREQFGYGLRGVPALPEIDWQKPGKIIPLGKGASIEYLDTTPFDSPSIEEVG